MTFCINPFSCPYRTCKAVHHNRRKFYKTLIVCQDYDECVEKECKRFHPTRKKYFPSSTDTRPTQPQFFPPDILDIILHYLTFSDIVRLHTTSKQFEGIFDHIKNPLKIKYHKDCLNIRTPCKITSYELINEHSLCLREADGNAFILYDLHSYHQVFLWTDQIFMPTRLNPSCVYLGKRHIEPYRAQLNELVDAMDHEGVWYAARVIGIDQQMYIVHFLSWSPKWNIRIPIDSFSIAKLFTFTPDWKRHLSINDPVDVRMNKLWYEGRVLQVFDKSVSVAIHFRNGNHRILKFKIDDESLAMSGMHTKLYRSDRSSKYCLKYHIANLMDRLKPGSVPLYLNRRGQHRYLENTLYEGR